MRRIDNQSVVPRPVRVLTIFFSIALLLCCAVATLGQATPASGPNHPRKRVALQAGADPWQSDFVAAPSLVAQQTPEQLCKCAGNDAVRKGGLRTQEEFQKQYGSRFKSAQQGQLAWRIYQASNRCDAVMVVGRLADTAGFEGKPGYCVLRGLPEWAVVINDIFIHGGTDRQARFMLVSQAPMETLGPIRPEQVEQDRETNWRVIYNHEISEITRVERYRLVGNPDKFSPATPGWFEPKPCSDISGVWAGTLVVKQVRGATNIAVGQSRAASVMLEQTGCRLSLRFGNNEIAGYLTPGEGPPRVTGTLEDNVTGALIRAELFASPTGPLDLTIAQRAPNGAAIVSSGKLNRK